MRAGYGFLVVLCLMLWAVPAFTQDEPETPFYLGVDLSYTNEMEDCGATYRVNGVVTDPYQIFKDYGTNLVRIRLWHNPDWTEYSTLDDVIRSLRRAKELGMNVLLDFHNSDTWADPSKQIIPAAWADIDDVDELGEQLYQYIYDTLMELDSLGLMPEMVQVGNEINSEVLRAEDSPGYPINWERNAFLINKGIQAVRDVGAQGTEAPRVMLHISKPEAVEGWFKAAAEAGVTDYDIIGISYHPFWSTHSIRTTGNTINKLRHEFNKDVMIVETSYPWTLDSVPESAGNILGEAALERGYPATPEGQKQFMINLAQSVFNSGGLGVVYWGGEWVSTDCYTLWGQGSHWENATFFDFTQNNEVLPGIEFLQNAYTYPADVTFKFQTTDGDAPETIYFWGDFTGMGRRMLQLELEDGEYMLRTRLMAGTEIRYQFYSALPASPENSLLPQDCLDDEGYVSVVIPDEATSFVHTSESCPIPPA
jgi:arabinogalactan endo-1,4-beta-galactosidase